MECENLSRSRFSCLFLLTVATVACGAFATWGAPPGGKAGDAANENSEGESPLPAGTIQRGTLANENLIRDAQMGIAAACGIMGMSAPKRLQPYIVQESVGPPGSRCWREKWVVRDDRGELGEVNLRFEEDGNGGAYWTVEETARLPVEEKLPADETAARQANDGKFMAGGDAAVRAAMDRYVATAKKFVANAEQGDVDGMVALTSAMTIANHGGSEPLKKFYIERYVPRFQESTMTWNQEHDLITDEAGNRGVEVGGAVTGNKSHPVYVGVMREGGKLVVIGVRVKSQADLLRERSP